MRPLSAALLLTVAAASACRGAPAPPRQDAPPPPPLTAQPERPPLWAGLEPGPHAVGFRSFWEIDPARTQAIEGDPTPAGPRPILVNAWYPAEPGDRPPMTHGEYLRIDTDHPAARALATALAAYARDIVVEETTGQPESELSDQTRRALDAMLASPSGAVRDATPAPGPSPLVLYHAGYGSSFEDNAVLCEYLASHGYLVLGSAFQEGDGSSFNIDAGEDSEKDLECLVRIAHREWSVEPERCAIIGHSGGAHTAIRFVSRHNAPVRALVSLDTTQDYHSFEDKRWDDFVPGALEHAALIDFPVLFAARQHAMFRLADRLTSSDRLYLTFRDLEHNSFIAQGVIRAETVGDPAAADHRAGYNELCVAIRLFLDAHMRESDAASDELRTRWKGALPGVSPVVAERVAPGVSAPPPYEEGRNAPPTARQAASWIDAGECARLERAILDHAGNPGAAHLYEPEFALSVLLQLVCEGRAADAERIHAAYGDRAAELARLSRSLERFYGSVGAPETAARFRRLADALAPAPSDP